MIFTGVLEADTDTQKTFSQGMHGTAGATNGLTLAILGGREKLT